MTRFYDLLRLVIRAVVRHAPWIVGVALILTGLGGYLAAQLSINTDFSELLPSDYDSVQALEKLRRTVGGESDAAVVIQSPSFQANKRFAEDLIPRALDLSQPGGEPYFSRVMYRRDEEFIRQNALYFASDGELSMLETFLQDRIEEAKLEANPFYFDLEEDTAETVDEVTEEELRAVYNQLAVKEYPISDDSTLMVLRFYPTGAQTNIGYIERAFDRLRSVVQELNPSSYHPQMEVEYGGRLRRQLIEIQAITQDVSNSLGAGITGVLLVVMLYFAYKSYRSRRGRNRSWRQIGGELIRLPVTAVVIGLPLGMSLTWTFGFAYLVLGMLNLMTATLGLVLFGLGIDYGIHFYARYIEERGDGLTVIDAAEATFLSTGQAIGASAMTTAAALYVLMIADFRGFSEFGALAGTGILFALVAMVIVLPALISLLERTPLLEFAQREEYEAPDDGRDRFPAAGMVLAASVVSCIAALIFIPRVSFEYDFGDLEPEYEEYEAIDAKIGKVYSSSGKRNPAYIVADSTADVPEIAEELRERAVNDTTSPTILSVETLQERFPTDSTVQQQKLQRIAEIRELLDSQYLAQTTSEDLERLRQAAQTQEPIPLEEVPAYLKAPFTTKQGTVGNLVIVYPSVGLSDARLSMAFARDVGTVRTDEGEVYHAGSTALVAADMFRVIQRESPWMVGLTFAFVVVLMLLIFRSVRWAGMALLPLVVGIMWMLGLVELLGLQLNFYNLVVLPAILGIGNDAGVHIVYRYREQGSGSVMEVLRSTGEHVSVGSLTTIIGFSGLLLSFHPGLKSMGYLAVVGIGSTLLAAVIFLPSLLQWMENRKAAPREAERADVIVED